MRRKGMRRKGTLKRTAIGLAALLLLGAALAAALSQRLELNHYTIASPKVGREIRLAVASDLHTSRYGEGQSRLIQAVLDSGAEALLAPGDMADSVAELEGMRALVEGLNGLPVFYTTGNHECASGDETQIKAALRALGVTVLEGQSVDFGEIRIAGTDDPQGLTRARWREQIDACRADDETFTLLLAHRPDRIESYSEGFDITVSGHAHGGQMRIPGLLPGLYAPNQGWFPSYTSGLYPAGEGWLLVSRGLARSAVPRLFNRPELAILHVVPLEN